MRPTWPQITGDNLNKLPPEVRSNLGQPAQLALQQAELMLRNGLSIRDNQNAALVTLGDTTRGQVSLTSGAEYLLKNPLKAPPIGFTPIYAVNSSGTALVFDNASLNLSRTDGFLGVTVNFGLASQVGEYVSASVLQGSAVSLTSTLTRTITSITLSPGLWDVSGIVCFTGGAITGTHSQAHIATAADSISGSERGDSWTQTPWTPTATADETLTIPANGRTVAASTSLYLNATCAFTAGNAKAYGRISATRRSFAGQTGIVFGILWGG